MKELISRDIYLNRLIDKRENGLIKVVTGIRRCGKSTLLFEIFQSYLLADGVPEEQIISVALDDDQFIRCRDPEQLSGYIRSKIVNRDMYYILIDEVQYAISREEFKKPEDVRLYDVLNGLMRLTNVDIYVTGSNSKLLTKDVMTAFRGRGDQVRVYPLSFQEYFDAVKKERGEAYADYALYGGMPQLLSFKNETEKMNYLKELFSEVYFKDIRERYEIRLPDVLQELTDALCSSIGSLTNAKKIADTLGTVKNTEVSTATIAKYLEYLTESFLFCEAKRYDVKGKKYFEYPQKYYCADVGLRNARLNFRQQEDTHIMENIIYNELLCRGYAVDVGVVEFAEKKNGQKNSRQCEIDFVVNRGSKRYYIQSALSVEDPEKMETELRPFRYTKDFFKKIIVTQTQSRAWTDEEGILHMGLYDFLLDPDALER